MKFAGGLRAANLACACCVSFIVMLAMTSRGLAMGDSTTSCPSVSGFTARTDVDSKYNDIRKVNTTNLDALTQACTADCTCNAFNNHGWLKTKASAAKATPGWCLYTKINNPGCKSNSSGVGMGWDGSCGGWSGSCTGGMCCSQYNYCGTSSAYCGSGCKPAYGKCGSAKSSPPPPPPRKSPPPPPRSSGTCSSSGSLTGVSGSCVTDNNSECCVNGQKYAQYKCSPAVTSATVATLTLNGFDAGQDGGGASMCDGQFHSNSELIVAMSTGWVSSRCLRQIIISANGRSVSAKVVDECDSVNGCDSDHAFQPPCKNNIVDASDAVNMVGT